MEEIRQPVNKPRKKIIALIVFTAVAVIGIITVYFYLQYKSTHITTDDAFVDGNIHTIASKVSGTVKGVYVKSNQFVKKGDILVELDEKDYTVKIEQARSAYNAEKAGLAENDAKIASAKDLMSELGARANAIKGLLEMQEAELGQAESDLRRAENLYKLDAISKERYEKALTSYKSAQAKLKAATEGMKYGLLSVDTQRSALKQAEAARMTQLSAIKEKEALLKDAELKHGYTKIYAPADGYITKKTVEIGNQIKENQPLMAIVSLENLSLVANYKETQLKKIRPGQKVKIKVDTYPGKVFWGKVDSIMAGTGAVFSLFPPENATGNYVKVVQRIPVKIVLDKDTDKEHILRIGMSVVPTVLIE